MYGARPIGDRLLVKPFKDNDAGHVWLPNGSMRQSVRAVVLAIGDDVRYVETGDVLMLSDGHGIDVQVDGDRLLLVTEDHVLLVLETQEVRS